MTDDYTSEPDTGSDDAAGLDADVLAVLSDEATWVTPAEDLGDRVAAAVRSEATLGGSTPEAAGIATHLSRRAWLGPALLGAAAALLLVVGGVVVLSAVGGGVEQNETLSAELISTGLIADVGGDIEITSLDSGLRIELDAPALPRRDNGAFYSGWVRTE